MRQGIDTPWDGFYMTAIPQHPAAIANAYGIWFEIRKRTIESIGLYEAFHLAWPMFLLKNWPIIGIDMYQLEISGDIQQTMADVPSPFRNTDANEPRAQFSSKIEQGWGGSNPQRPRRGSFGASDSDEEKPRNNKYVRLEGIPPKEFDGDWSKTHQFLIQFKHFMWMNDGAWLLVCSYWFPWGLFSCRLGTSSLVQSLLFHWCHLFVCLERLVLESLWCQSFSGSFEILLHGCYIHMCQDCIRIESFLYLLYNSMLTYGICASL